MKIQLVALILLPFLWACSNPRVEGSSDEELKESIEKVRGSLPEEDRTRFDQAIQELAFADVSLQDMMSAGQGVDLIGPKMKDRVLGKTATEILAEADQIRAQREQREREQAFQEIAELRKKEQKAANDREKLATFEVTRSRFYKKPQRYGRPQPIIELSVKNGTDSAVSRAYFRGTLASPGRSVPWLKDTFNYPISGGIEPGETASWKLAPNSFSDWGTVDSPADAVFTVEVTKIDGPDGETLYDSEGLSEYEQNRLDELTKKFGPLN